MEEFHELLACPVCRSGLDRAWRCGICGSCFAAPDGIPELRLKGDVRTERVREFYSSAPFPGYRESDSLDHLKARAERSTFARLLDSAIPGDAKVLEVGCGTGQMCLYLACADRLIVGADLTRASLLLGASAARRFGVDRVQFVETDLHSPGLKRGAFDVVYSSGVLHHTPDPQAAFARIVELARPGGMIVIGLYNAFARMPLRLRRFVARLTGYNFIPFDPVLKEREHERERREAWLRDQYLHPEEHRHTIAEVRSWFEENGVEYLRTYPSSLIGEDPGDLAAFETDAWGIESLLVQIGWMRTLSSEGGLFITVGLRNA